ncbi:hypothetical protein ACFV2X_54025 [Streptomyces sp. NPDC059679]|uniref:hypothetical protein n=1 Tax=Streptomyces sp. NPDC059679 TaxID=3346903 RepID=UPI0036B165D3
MKKPIAVSEVLACIHLAQAAHHQKRQNGTGDDSHRGRFGDTSALSDFLDPLLRAARPIAGMDALKAYSGANSMTPLRLAATVVLTADVLWRQVRASDPGAVTFHLGPGAPSREAFEIVGISEFGQPVPEGESPDHQLHFVSGAGEGTCKIHVAGPEISDRLALPQARPPDLDLFFRIGESRPADLVELREGSMLERAAPDPVARMRSVPLVLDLMMGRRRFDKTITRVVCEVEGADSVTDEQLIEAVNLFDKA